MPSREESETHVWFCEADEYASIYTTRRAVWKMCEAAGWRLVLEDQGGREYRGPRESLRLKVRSEAQMGRARQRALAAARGRQKAHR